MSIPTYGISLNLEFSHRYATQAPLSVDAIVGIVSDGTAEALKYFPTLELAMASSADYAQDSGVMNTLKDLKACNTECKVVISSFIKNNDATTHKNNAKKAIQNLLNSEKTLMQKPRFILANELTGPDYFAELKGVAEKLGGIFFWESDKSTVNEVKTQVPNCKSPRCVTSFQKVVRADGQNTQRPLSSFILGNWLRILGFNESGLRETFSNKTISGITSIVDHVTHSYTAELESNELRKLGVTCAVNAPTLTFWGDGVRDEQEDRFTVIKDQLILDLVQERLIETYRLFIDQPMSNVLPNSVRTATAIMDNLRTRGIIIGFAVSPNAKKNTPGSLASGNIYIDIKFQTNINCKFIGITIEITDEFTQNVLTSI